MGFYTNMPIFAVTLAPTRILLCRDFGSTAPFDCRATVRASRKTKITEAQKRLRRMILCPI
jgi:hypothetical protein